MFLPRCNTLIPPLLSLLAAGTLVTARPSSALAADLRDSNALIMTAEIALRREDCGQATADYAAAAEHLTDARVAQRAATVALECGQFQAAESIAARWHQLRPQDPAPLRAQVRAELGLFRIDAARGAFENWLRVRGSSGAARAGGEGGDGNARTGGADAAVAAQVQEVAQQSGVPATLAMLRGVHVPSLESGAGQLALAGLAIDGWNYHEALEYAQSALNKGAEPASAQLLLARAHAGLGDADQAVAAANAARAAAPKQQTFADADVLILLGRDREAREAIEALSQNPALKAQAERRLGLLDFDAGNYDEAQKEFSSLLSDHDSAAIAVYYLAAIAERRGDIPTALRGYQLLGGTALESAARMRIATMVLKSGHAREALQLLAAPANASPSAQVDAEIAQAELLADGGQAEQALARLDDALARAPGHPDLLYQKAIVLEKGGRTDAAVDLLATLRKQRPSDGELANALGFILADHNRDLSRAQDLIELALKAEPDNPAILDSLGWLDYRRGMAREALPLLQRAFRLDQDGDIGAHWGEVLWSLGEKGKAREAWSRALIADPDNAAVKAAEKRAGAPQLLTPGAGTSV